MDSKAKNVNSVKDPRVSPNETFALILRCGARLFRDLACKVFLYFKGTSLVL